MHGSCKHPRLVETVFAALAMLGQQGPDSASNGMRAQQQLPAEWGFCLHYSAMSQHLEDSPVQQYACLAIALSCKGHQKNAQHAIAAGLIDSVENALVAHPEQCDVQRWGCTALCEMITHGAQHETAGITGLALLRVAQLARVIEGSIQRHTKANSKTRKALTRCIELLREHSDF